MRFPVTDDYAAIAPRITGSTSALSSSLIIFIIARSKPKLRTIYHRIMLGMSCADILGSVAMGLTTLPMPSELRPGYNDYYWSGSRLGNVATCRAQGFFFVFGISCMFAYNGALCLYYACAIAFQMEEATIKRRVEPFLHIVPIVLGLVMAVPPLALDLYNPSGFEAWCTVMGTKEFESSNARSLIGLSTTIAIASTIIFVFVCLLLVVRRVAIVQRELKSMLLQEVDESRRNGGAKIDRTDPQAEPVSDAESEDALEEGSQDSWNARRNLFIKVEEAHQNTKVVCVQALAYVTSFLIVLSCPFANAVTKTDSYAITRLLVILVPLQGFFNCIIFISHKIYSYRRSNYFITTCEILRRLFHEAEEPVLFSRISLIQYDQNQQRIKIMLENEERVEQLQLSVSGSGMQVQVDNEESNDDGLSGFDISQRSSMKSAGISYAADSRSVRRGEQKSSVGPSQLDDRSSSKFSHILSRSALFAMKRNQEEQQQRTKNTKTDDFDDDDDESAMDDFKNDTCKDNPK